MVIPAIALALAFITTAPAGTSNDNLLHAGWTDPRTGIQVRQEMWNCPCGRQTLRVHSSSRWSVTSNQNAGETVKTYPDAQQVLTRTNNTPRPLSSLGMIQSVYHIRNPQHGTWNAAYDIWLNDYNIEVMIWTFNRHATPAGHKVGTTQYYGRTFTVWADNADRIYSLVMHGNRTRDRVHILSALRALRHMGFIHKSEWNIDAIEFGWEIRSSKNLTFNVLNYRNIIRRA
jgi:hypothetical protein